MPPPFPACDELFNPEKMVEALQSDPKPTWYSSVPTIHNATVAFLLDNADKYGVKDGVWEGHGLRMIRSGAAALLAPDGAALGKMYGTPIFPTYSMSEQMPISQPPYGMLDQLNDKPGSVGVPVAATCAIVSAKTLRPPPSSAAACRTTRHPPASARTASASNAAIRWCVERPARHARGARARVPAST